MLLMYNSLIIFYLVDRYTFTAILGFLNKRDPNFFQTFCIPNINGGYFAGVVVFGENFLTLVILPFMVKTSQLF